MLHENRLAWILNPGIRIKVDNKRGVDFQVPEAEFPKFLYAWEGVTGGISFSQAAVPANAQQA
jgi:hypothetical protein